MLYFSFLAPGVYVATELIDFGIIRTFDNPKTVPINLINTGDTPVQLSVSIFNDLTPDGVFYAIFKE